MKKKFSIAIAISLVMAMTFGMTAFAKNSVTADDVVVKDIIAAAESVEVKEVKVPEGVSVKTEDVQVAAPTAEKAAEAVTVATTENTTITNIVAEVAAAAKSSTLINASIQTTGKDVTVAVKQMAAVVEVSIPAMSAADKDVIAEKGIDIAISAPAVQAGKSYLVLHQKADGTWESLPVTGISAGVITATFKSFSPVAIVEVEVTATSTGSTTTPATTPATTTASTTATSPKTGEATSAAGILAVICLAGAAICAKKVRYSK